MSHNARWIVASLSVGLFASGVASAVPAFPGAEGFGATATGGRGKPVYEVTTLDDAGPGSLRDAVSQGDRTIVFRVSGTIRLKSRLKVSHPNITIAGQTAPGDGICIAGHELFIADTQNVIVRFLRLRPGDLEKVEVDALTVWNSQHVIIDHCSLSWSTDSLNDVVKGSGNVTVQWCILAEPLMQSVHSKGAHGYATGWDGRIITNEDGTTTGGGGSYHHNLIAHASSRAPRIGYFNKGRGLIDCRNNVIYNSGSSYGGETDDFNYVANYYRPGPESQRVRQPNELFAIWAADSRMYAAGNVIEGAESPNGSAEGFISFKQGTNTDGTTREMPTAEMCLVPEAFKVAPVTTHSAEDAYALVVERAGAVRPTRDAADERVLADVKNRTGRFINSQQEVGGWPELKSAPAPIDTDRDGMPDAWETARGLDAANPADGVTIAADGYTHLEHYLNELAESK